MIGKKILIVTEYFYPEEFKINELALAWKEKGYEVDVLTQHPTYPYGEIFKGYKNRWFSKENYNGITIYRVKAVVGYKKSLFKKLLKYFTFMILGSVISLRIGRKYDYIFGFDIAALTCMVPAVLLKKFYNKKVTLWIQDIWPDSVYAYGFKKRKILSFLLDKFVRFVYRNSSNFAVTSAGFVGKIVPYLDKKKKIIYVPNWSDEFNRQLSPFKFSDEDKIQFTFAGNVGKVQNLDNVIEAFGKLEDRYLERAQLNIIGDGSHLYSLKELVKDRGIKNVIFWGRKPRNEMYKYFSGSDFLLVSLINRPIFSLTVPAKLQTYIAAGKPIFSIVNGDASRIVLENNLGYSAIPDDIEDIREKFIKCIESDDEQVRKFTKNCELLTNRIFNREKNIEALLNLLVEEI